MARKKKEAFTWESNVDKVIAKVQEKPQRVMNIIGQTIVKEVKATTLKQMYGRRTKILSMNLAYWARKQEKDLQIGFKMSIPDIIKEMVVGTLDPIKPVVIKNKELIANTITQALDEINKE